MARPIKLTSNVHNKIVSAIQGGNYIETAAAYAGISKVALYDWLKRGEKEKQRVAKNPKFRIKKEELPFVEFSNAVEMALAAAEMRDVKVISMATKEYWQAAAWRLERKFPHKWGRKVVDVNHSGSINIKNRAKEIDEYLRSDGDEK